MKKSVKIIISISLFLFFILFSFQLLTTRTIFNSYHFDSLRSLAYKLNNEFPEQKPSSSYIDNIYYDLDEEGYKIYINFKTSSKFKEIKVNDLTYTLNHYENKTSYFYFNSSINLGSDEQTYYITALINENRLIKINYPFTIYKYIDPNIIYDKQKSIVGISLGNVWGSGIIVDKKEITRKNFFGKQQKLYEYTIITAYHVIDKNLKISIHYNNTYNTYGDVKIVKTFTDNSDLAFLKLTTPDNSLIPLNDSQFITSNSVKYYKNDPVFLIGSPMNKKINFNKIKSGTIVSTFETITLNGQTKDALKTTASLTGGSSGGALFNKDGDLIGLHFAGDNSNIYAYAIHIETILAAMETLNAYNSCFNKTLLTIKKHLFENRCFF